MELINVIRRHKGGLRAILNFSDGQTRIQIIVREGRGVIHPKAHQVVQVSLRLHFEGLYHVHGTLQSYRFHEAGCIPAYF